MRRESTVFCCATLILITLIASAPFMALSHQLTEGVSSQSVSTTNSSITTNSSLTERYTFTLYDYAYVVYSKNKTTAYFDIPINYSDGTLNQKAYIVMYGGTTYLVGKGGNVSAKMKVYNGSQGYVVVRVEQVVRNLTPIILKIVNSPRIFMNYTAPKNVVKKYVRKPARIVVSKVVPAYEKWVNTILESKYNLSVRNVSKAFIAVSAAVFIYLSGYIHYNASAMPRTLNETILKHQGDCDDMSRVLINLLWYYGIPAKIVYGYVYLPPLNLTMSLMGSYMRFVNAGPHAFIMAYIPPIGWMSVDFLAGSLLSNPVVIQGVNLKGSVTKKDIKQIKKSLSQIRYAEEVYLYEDHIIPAYLNTTNKTLLLKILHRLLNPLIRLVVEGMNVTNKSVTNAIVVTNRGESNTSTITTLTTSKHEQVVTSAKPSRTAKVTTTSCSNTTVTRISRKHYRELSNASITSTISQTRSLIKTASNTTITSRRVGVGNSLRSSVKSTTTSNLTRSSRTLRVEIVSPVRSVLTVHKSVTTSKVATSPVSHASTINHSLTTFNTAVAHTIYSTPSTKQSTVNTASTTEALSHVAPTLISADALAFIAMLSIMAAVLIAAFLRRSK